MKRQILVLLAAALFTACNLGEPEREGWFTDEHTAARVDSLMQLMTLEEKIGQMVLFTSDMDVTGPFMRDHYVESIENGMVGAIF